MSGNLIEAQVASLAALGVMSIFVIYTYIFDPEYKDRVQNQIIEENIKEELRKLVKEEKRRKESAEKLIIEEDIKLEAEKIYEDLISQSTQEKAQEKIKDFKIKTRLDSYKYPFNYVQRSGLVTRGKYDEK